MGDDQLITAFSADRSEAAFAALVERHVNLVFATALRQLGDRGLAEEVAQNVFIVLARKAGSLRRHATVAGWLYHTTLNQARQRVRTELRRRRREEVAIALGTTQRDEASIWAPLVPLLDEALMELRETDRLAVVLHFLEDKPLREVGVTLGVGEDAARKRIHRCLDQLMAFFRRHGFAVPALTVSTPLFAAATQAAPAGLAGTVTAASLSAATGSLTTLGFIQLMASTKLKLALAAVVAAGVATPLILHQRAIDRLRRERATLQRQADEAERLRVENASLASSRLDAEEFTRLRAEHGELMRLRGEVARLRRRPSQADPEVPPTNTEQQTAPERAEATDKDALAPLKAVLTARLGDRQTLVTGGWSTKPGRRGLILVTPAIDTTNPDAKQVTFEAKFVETSDEMLDGAGLADLRNEGRSTSRQRVLNEPETVELIKALEASGTDLLVAPRVTTLDGRQAQVATIDLQIGPDGKQHEVGQTLDVIPRLAADGTSVEVTLVANWSLPDPRRDAGKTEATLPGGDETAQPAQ